MTEAFAALVAPARRLPQIWRLLLGTVLMALVYGAWLSGTVLVVRRLAPQADAPAMLSRIASGEGPGAMLILLLTFAGMALGAVVAAAVHGRGLRSLTGPPGRVLRHFVLAAATVALVYGAAGLVWSRRFDTIPNLPPGHWLALLPFALAGVALQTLAEELAFRGYLMQQLAARFRPALVWMGLPTLAFALLHHDPATAGANAWLVVLGIGLFALAAADLTRRTGSLGAAWGFHFANNCVALLILATGSRLSGLALWRTPYAARDPALVWSLATDACAMLAAWAILARLTRDRRAR